MVDIANKSKIEFKWISLTAGSILGLVAGMGLGIAAFETKSATLIGLANLVEPLGNLWSNALIMVIVPLVVSYLFVAIAKPKDVRKTGNASALAMALFVFLLITGSVISVLFAPPLLDFVLGNSEGIADIESVEIKSEWTAHSADVPTPAAWLTGLIPANPLKAIVNGEILSVLVVTVLFAFATTRIEAELRQLLVNFFQALADVTMTLVHWILRLLPLAVFAISLPVAAGTGIRVAGAFGIYIVTLSVVLLLFTVALYPLGILLGGMKFSGFARGLAPAQAVAMGTRSSLACLQPLVEGATQKMGMHEETAELVLPLSVSVFRFSQSISSPFKLLFLAHIYGLTLAPSFVLMFVIINFLLTFGSPGIPTRVVPIKLPLYLAAGIPIEGIILLGAIDAVPDMFKTLLNVTGSMTVATIVARFVPRSELSDEPQLGKQPA